MIKLILFLCRFSFINFFLKKLIIEYEKKQEQKTKKTASELCQMDMAKVNRFERLGMISGVAPPRILQQPK